MKQIAAIMISALVFLMGTGLPDVSPHGELIKEEIIPSNVQEIKKEVEQARSQEKKKSFADVVKDARKIEGLFNLYLKEDKLYFEILPEQFGKMYLFVPTLWRSLGNRGAGSYLPERIFFLEKLDQKILLLWKNVGLIAERSPQYKRALRNVIPDSIAFSFKIESEEHPEKKSLLVSVDDFFFSDLQHLSSFGDSSHPYAVDKAKTVWGAIKAFPENVELEVRYTVASARPMSIPTVADSSVFTINVRYSISELPVNNGYRPRLADDRIGYFLTKIYDYDKLDINGTVVRFINRWHLEKKDRRAAISEPEKPIVFWLENTIPLEYRKPIRDGILEWNKAFERIGFRNALVVKEMPDDAEWDPADIRYNTVRWIPSLVGTGGGAMGPSRVNPLTGEILDADVTIRAPLNFIFSYHALNKPLALSFIDSHGFWPDEVPNPWDQDNFFLGLERDFGILDLLASGKIKDIGEVPKDYIYDAIKQLACHEIGHTLGLRHNFKGSSTITLEDIHRPELTSKKSIGNSIMEYLPVNLAPAGIKQGDYFQKTLGAWDYWVIEYGYIPLDAKNPQDEIPELQKIASRAGEPALVYGTDEDAYDIGPYSSSIDPLCQIYDLTDDPLSYSEQQISRIRDLWKQLENRVLFQGRSYAYLRQAFESTLSRYFGFIERLTKWIGGVYHSRVHVNAPEKELPFKVVEYEKQRRAFEIIKANLLKPEAFKFSSSFIQKLQIDRSDALQTWDDAAKMVSLGRFTLDFSLSHFLEEYYRRILRSLFDPMRLHRIQDNELRTEEPVLKLDEFFDNLFVVIWEELEKNEPIGLYRRILQQECLTRIAELIQNPGPALPRDVIAISRFQLKKLNKKIADYLARNRDADLVTEAHLEHCADVIEQVLKTSYVKTIN